MLSFYLFLGNLSAFLCPFSFSRPLPLSPKKEKVKGKKSDVEYKILLDTPDFLIKRKGFQSTCTSSVQKGIDPLPPRTGESDSISYAFRDTGMCCCGLRGEDSFPSSTCGTGGRPGAAIPPTQSPRAGAFPSFITSLPPSLDVSPGFSSGGGEDGTGFGGSRYQDPCSTGVGVGVEYEVMRAQSRASKAESRHCPPPAPPSSPAQARVCTSN